MGVEVLSRARAASRRRAYGIALAYVGTVGLACGSIGLPQTKPEHPKVQFPARFGENGTEPAKRAPDASAPSPESAEPDDRAANAGPATAAPNGSRETRDNVEPSGREHGDPPDPPALSARGQWHFPIEYERGVLRVGAPAFRCLPHPARSARRIGRYAFEMWLGRELIERVRFDLPLLAAEAPPSGPRRELRDPPRFAPGARVSTQVQIPANERANRARVLDRATGESVEVPWPPPLPAKERETCSHRPAAPAAGGPRNPGTPR